MALTVVVNKGAVGTRVTNVQLLESDSENGTYTAISGQTNVLVSSFPVTVTNVNDDSRYIKMIALGICSAEVKLIITGIPTAWSTEDPMTIAKSFGGAAGTATGTFAYGGNFPSGCAEYYNGTAWSNNGAMVRPVQFGTSFGEQNDAYSIGGFNANSQLTNFTSAWNGFNWTTCQIYPALSNLAAGTGTGNAGLVMGGSSFPSGYNVCSKEWNGSAWSNGGNLQVARTQQAASGTQTAALMVTGNNSGNTVNCTEEYDGSSWSLISGGNVNTARLNPSAAGTQNSTILAGGSLGYPNVNPLICTEEYNGTTWSTGGSLTNCRTAAGMTPGASNADLVFGGLNSTQAITCTEKFNG